MGTWDGEKFSKIKKIFPLEFEKRGNDIINYKTPCGESFFECSLRAINAFIKITKESKEDIVIISHAGINRCILCTLLKIDLKNMFSIPQDYGCINIIEKKEDEFLIKQINFLPKG